jgi:hypothetical protein
MSSSLWSTATNVLMMDLFRRWVDRDAIKPAL